MTIRVSQIPTYSTGFTHLLVSPLSSLHVDYLLIASVPPRPCLPPHLALPGLGGRPLSARTRMRENLLIAVASNQPVLHQAQPIQDSSHLPSVHPITESQQGLLYLALYKTISVCSQPF